MKHQISKISQENIAKAEKNLFAMIGLDASVRIELENLLDKLTESNARAIKSLETAHKSIQRTLRCMEQRRRVKR